jgi:hypothetical protein
VKLLAVGDERSHAMEHSPSCISSLGIAHQLHRYIAGARAESVHATEPLDQAVGGAGLDDEMVAIDVGPDLDA